MVSEKVANIIEALGKHHDNSSIEVLVKVGTNCENDEIRELTARALIRKNDEKALRYMLLSRGKGVNDLSSNVAMSTINEIIALKDKTKLYKIIDDTLTENIDNDIRDTIRSVKALITYSN